ncbi:MAG: hypothetical protein HC824_03320 [Synechococcales cyanobacterium RM1_1_8]|nr:hypothetical protein [Synechococcales cyanobacterium RM1_1_8]
MDSETRQAINQLRERVAGVNESLEITTEALGAFMEECTGTFANINQTLQILVDESRFSRKQVMDQINELRQRIDELD